MSQYLLSVWGAADELYDADLPDVDQIYADVDKVNAEMQDAGVWVFAGGLLEPATATVVRPVDGDVIVTDGPFAESKEQIGGFWVIEAADLDAALGWARKAAVACRGPVEVRPFEDIPAE